MPLPIETEKAIADEKAKRPQVADDHDLKELIERTAKPKAKEEKEEKPPDKKLTDEALDKATESLANRLGFRKAKEEKKEEKKDEKPEPTGDVLVGGPDDTIKKSAEAEDKVDDDAKEEKPKKAKVSKKPDIDPIEIASAAAARTAEHILSGQSRKETQEKTPVVDETLSEEERGNLEVFREMAKTGSDKELPRKYLSYLKRSEDYQRKWETDHPGEEFNPEAGDHDSFYAKHEPKYSELEYKKAIVRMESKSSSNVEIENLTKEHKRLQAELAARELDPVINQASIGALAEVIKGLDENILKAIEKDGFQKYAETNEVEADLIKDVAARIGPFITGLLQFDDVQGRIPFNEKNPAHIEAVNYLRAKEQELARKSMRERYNDEGKVLVPRAEYFRMSDIQKMSHAYLDTQSLLAMRVAEEAEMAQTRYQKELKKAEARAKALGWLPPARKENGQDKEKEEEKSEEKAPPARSELKSPEASSSSRIDTSGDQKLGDKKDLLDSTASILFRR